MSISKLPAPSDSSFERAPEGTHLAVCYQIIDLGTQESSFYKSASGAPKKAHKVLLAWELPEERGEDGKPLVIARRYTFSSHKNSVLRGHLEAWRGKAFSDEEITGFDLKTVLGAPCLLSVVHTKDGDKEYANVNAVTKLTKGMTRPVPENACIYFSLEPPFADGVFKMLSEGLREVIQKSPEYAALFDRKVASGGFEAPAKSGARDELDDEISF